MEQNKKPTYKDDEQILTFEELEKCKGKYVYFSHKYGKYYYAWIKKVTKVILPHYLLMNQTEKEIKKSIRHLNVYGTYSMVIYKGGRKLQKPIPSCGDNPLKEKMSNAQWAARLPTKEELKLYLNTIRKYRIYESSITFQDRKLFRGNI